MRAVWLAVQFLTRLPTPRVEIDATARGTSVLFYPLVGLLIGALLALLHWPLATTDAGLEAALLLLVWVLVTGGLHLDGLADSADAWLGSHGDRARALAIMKDPYTGPAGTAAVVLVLLIKFAALSALLWESAWEALVVAPLLGRAALVALLLTMPYVRPDGIGAEHAAHLPRISAAGVLVATGVAVVAWLEWDGLWLLAAAAVAVYGLRYLMLRRLGGTTGDTLGASCEIVEATVLVTLALLWIAPA
ncbi:MAG: adenosylcobinamide-GDP ribazoletransferase [Gammaproteobacteria bacterium]|nr:MAG: adenosylcobinamide-GDP ribazoletransferase [Gammaproteobacteria bacterium]